MSKSNPPPCDPKIFSKGISIGLYDTGADAKSFEALVQQVREESGLPIDWHYAGGRANLKCLPKHVEKLAPYVERIINHGNTARLAGPILTAIYEDLKEHGYDVGLTNQHIEITDPNGYSSSILIHAEGHYAQVARKRIGIRHDMTDPDSLERLRQEVSERLGQ